MGKMSKKEYDEAVREILGFINKEIENWKKGIYKNSPEIQDSSKKEIVKNLLILPDLVREAMISKLIEEKIFNITEIDKALEIPIEKRKLITAKELLESNIPDEEMIVSRGLIPKSGFALIGGLAKEGKTLLSLQFGLSLVSGNHFLEEFPIVKKCRVLYIFHENTLQGLNAIIKKQLAGLGNLGIKISKKDIGNFYLRDGREIILSLRNPIIKDLKRDLNIVKPDVIFLDPIGQFIGFDINKAENIKRFADLLKEICDCFWILIHHYTKPRFLAKGEKDIIPIYKLLGSSYLANSCETFLGLEPEGENYSSDYKRIYFVLRRESVPLPLHLKRDSNSLIYEVVDSISLIRGRITKEDIIKVLKDSFKGKASYKDLVSLCSEQFGIKEERIANLLKELKESGVIAKEEGRRGLWYIKEIFSDHF